MKFRYLTVLCFLFFQSMATGGHGANGPFVLRPVEVVTTKGPERVLTQPLGMVVVPAKGPASKLDVVTQGSAQVINGVV